MICGLFLCCGYSEWHFRLHQVACSLSAVSSLYSVTMRVLALLSLLILAGCSSSSAPTPGPSPVASRATIAGTITDTVTGARVGSFSQDVDRLPALIPVSAAGFLTRQAWIMTAQPTVDLIPEAGFDLTFYRQFVRGALDGRMEPLRRWIQPPSIYLQRTGLSDATVAALEQAAREAVIAFTGGQYGVTAWETGEGRRAAQSGWIMVELVNNEDSCGRAVIGGGTIWLNTAERCHRNGAIILSPNGFTHEIGHTMGFWHVPSGLMQTPLPPNTLISPRERHHAALAYARPVGSQDVDQDPSSGSGLSALQSVVD